MANWLWNKLNPGNFPNAYADDLSYISPQTCANKSEYASETDRERGF